MNLARSSNPTNFWYTGAAAQERRRRVPRFGLRTPRGVHALPSSKKKEHRYRKKRIDEECGPVVPGILIASICAAPRAVLGVDFSGRKAESDITKQQNCEDLEHLLCPADVKAKLHYSNSLARDEGHAIGLKSRGSGLENSRGVKSRASWWRVVHRSPPV